MGYTLKDHQKHTWRKIVETGSAKPYARGAAADFLDTHATEFADYKKAYEASEAAAAAAAAERAAITKAAAVAAAKVASRAVQANKNLDNSELIRLTELAREAEKKAKDARAVAARAGEITTKTLITPLGPLRPPTKTAPFLVSYFYVEDNQPKVLHYFCTEMNNSGACGVVFLGVPVTYDPIAGMQYDDSGEPIVVKLDKDVSLGAETVKAFVEHEQVMVRTALPGAAEEVVKGFDKGNYPMVAMPLAEGESLDAWTKRERDLKRKCFDGSLAVQRDRREMQHYERMTICSKVIGALKTSREVGLLVHRDLKPANIVFNPTANEASLIDFGMAVLKPDFNESVKSDDFLNTVLVGATPYITPRRFYWDSATKSYVAPMQKDDDYAMAITLAALINPEKDSEIGELYREPTSDIPEEGDWTSRFKSVSESYLLKQASFLFKSLGQQEPRTELTEAEMQHFIVIFERACELDNTIDSPVARDTSEKVKRIFISEYPKIFNALAKKYHLQQWEAVKSLINSAKIFKWIKTGNARLDAAKQAALIGEKKAILAQLKSLMPKPISVPVPVATEGAAAAAELTQEALAEHKGTVGRRGSTGSSGSGSTGSIGTTETGGTRITAQSGDASSTGGDESDDGAGAAATVVDAPTPQQTALNMLQTLFADGAGKKHMHTSDPRDGTPLDENITPDQGIALDGDAIQALVDGVINSKAFKALQAYSVKKAKKGDVKSAWINSFTTQFETTGKNTDQTKTAADLLKLADNYDLRMMKNTNRNMCRFFNGGHVSTTAKLHAAFKDEIESAISEARERVQNQASNRGPGAGT